MDDGVGRYNAATSALVCGTNPSARSESAFGCPYAGGLRWEISCSTCASKALRHSTRFGPVEALSKSIGSICTRCAFEDPRARRLQLGERWRGSSQVFAGVTAG